MATLVAGLVLWLPVLGSGPWDPPVEAHGPVRLSRRTGRGPGLLVVCPDPGAASPVQRRSPVPGLAIGLRPLNDQQIAGFVSKLAMLIVLLAVGTVFLLRADEESTADDPLVWADVQRQFERADRRAVRTGRHLRKPGRTATLLRGQPGVGGPLGCDALT